MSDETGRPSVEDIFNSAAAMASPGQRAEYLDQVCGDDASLRAKVDLLLRHDADAGSFLEKTPAEIDGLAPTLDSDRPGSDSFDTARGDDSWRALLSPSQRDGALGRLGQYDVLELVGRGGMGVVLRAFDPKLSRMVAVKLLAPELAAQPLAVQRFLREARAAAAVSHDHVVSIYAIDDEARPPRIVMELIDGKSLQQKIDETGALDVKSVLRIGMQTAAGLSAAHRQGLVHRDIKPANILLENGIEKVKLTDFGLARAVDDIGMTQTGQITGTPQYMSPEQAQGQRVDHRTDLFSLGCVLYAMCTGRAAFRADSAVAVLHRIVHDTPSSIRELNVDIPDWLCAIVDKLLAKNPEDRFASAVEVEELLGGCLAHLQQPDSVPLPTEARWIQHNSAVATRDACGVQNPSESSLNARHADPSTEHSQQSVVRNPGKRKLDASKAALLLCAITYVAAAATGAELVPRPVGEAFMALGTGMATLFAGSWAAVGAIQWFKARHQLSMAQHLAKVRTAIMFASLILVTSWVAGPSALTLLIGWPGTGIPFEVKSHEGLAAFSFGDVTLVFEGAALHDEGVGRGTLPISGGRSVVVETDEHQIALKTGPTLPGINTVNVDGYTFHLSERCSQLALPNSDGTWASFPLNDLREPLTIHVTRNGGYRIDHAARTLANLDDFGRQNSPGATDATSVKNLSTEIIRSLLPKAAGVPTDQFQNMARGVTGPDNAAVTGTPLSFVLLTLHPSHVADERRELAAEEFRYLSTPIIKPSDLVKAISRHPETGFATFIQPEYIQSIAINVAAETEGASDTASGVVTFEAPELFAGRVHYSARRTNGEWQITDFQLPAYGVHIRRDNDNVWRTVDQAAESIVVPETGS